MLPSCHQPLHLAHVDVGGPEEYHLCPACTLQSFVKATAELRSFDNLFVCFAGSSKERSLPEQRLAHWVGGATRQAYAMLG